VLVTDTAAETEKALVENLLAAIGNKMDDAVTQTKALIHHPLDLAPAGFGFANDNIDIVFLEAFKAIG